ncbi:hypothetical protein [Gottfriedia solisilvae]|uniref:hypothetical protein n=1 Tax=Gottfriedia solisilvae TaxID=1516104 RepID=UPI003D2EA32D
MTRYLYAYTANDSVNRKDPFENYIADLDGFVYIGNPKNNPNTYRNTIAKEQINKDNQQQAISEIIFTHSIILLLLHCIILLMSQWLLSYY